MSEKTKMFEKDLEKVSGGENEDYGRQNPAKFYGFHIGDRVSVVANLLGQGTQTHYGNICDWSYGNGIQFDRVYGGYKIFPVVSIDGISGKYTFNFQQLTKVN